MNDVFTEEGIKNKLSGKYSHLYPVYEKIRDELFKIGENTKIFLKTIYMRIDFDNGTFGVLYWKDDALEFALPIKKDHERLVNAKHLRWKGLDKMLRLSTVEDIDNFVINLFKDINNHR